MEALVLAFLLACSLGAVLLALARLERRALRKLARAVVCDFCPVDPEHECFVGHGNDLCVRELIRYAEADTDEEWRKTPAHLRSEENRRI